MLDAELSRGAARDALHAPQRAPRWRRHRPSRARHRRRRDLPLSESGALPERLGTRHRAALGITEQTDAVAVVVSEETGAISLVERAGSYAISISRDWRKRLSSCSSTTSCPTRGCPTSERAAQDHSEAARAAARASRDRPRASQRAAHGFGSPRPPSGAELRDTYGTATAAAASPAIQRAAAGPSEARRRLPAAQLAPQAGRDPARDGPVQRPRAGPERAHLDRPGAGRRDTPAGRARPCSAISPRSPIRYRAPLDVGVLSPDSFRATVDLSRVEATAGGRRYCADHGDRARPAGPDRRLRAARGAGPAGPGRGARDAHDSHPGHRA